MGLQRSTDKKMIAGVLAGIAEAYKWDVSLVRLAMVLLTVFTGFMPLLIAYIAAWIIIPEKGA